MKSYSSSNIDLFEQLCTNWDQVNTQDFVLPTGEDVHTVVKEKSFGEGHFIKSKRLYVFGVLIERQCDFLREGSGVSMCPRSFQEISQCPTTKKLRRKISEFEFEQECKKTKAED